MKVLPIVLETLSITRVGATGVYFDYSAADLVTYKVPLQINDENYYIPAISATSFKGVLRSTYEKFLRRREVSSKEKENVLNRSNSLNDEEKEKIKGELRKELGKYTSASLIDEVRDNFYEAFKQYLDVTGYGIDKACYVTSDLDRCENLELIEDDSRHFLKLSWIKLTGRNRICEVCKVLGTSGIRRLVKFTDL